MKAIHLPYSTLIISLLHTVSVKAFTTSFVTTSTIRRNSFLTASLRMIAPNSEFEDFQNSDGSTSEGQELARQFYQQLERRKQERTSLEDEQYSLKNDVDANKEQNKKFTGQRGEIDSTGTPSAGLFARGNGSVYAFPVEKRTLANRSSASEMLSPREKMMNQEINFMNVASSEVTIVLQGVLVLVLLLFAVYVGVSGGITDGSERFGGAEDLTFTYEVVQENSVWL